MASYSGAGLGAVGGTSRGLSRGGAGGGSRDPSRNPLGTGTQRAPSAWQADLPGTQDPVAKRAPKQAGPMLTGLVTRRRADAETLGAGGLLTGALLTGGKLLLGQ